MAWIGGVLNLVGGRRDNMFNKEEADKNRDWQRNMSNTEVWRRVQDLKSAGLNPMLAYNGAASTPSGSSANAAGGSDFASGMAAWASAQNLKANTDKLKSETEGQEIANAREALALKDDQNKAPYSAVNAQRDAENKLTSVFQNIENLGLTKLERALRTNDVEVLMPLRNRIEAAIASAHEYGLSEKQAISKFYEMAEDSPQWIRMIKELLIGIGGYRDATR